MLIWTTALIALGTSAEDLSRKLETCEQQYDLACAQELKTLTVSDNSAEGNLLHARACLLIAELKRTRYECTAEEKTKTRRALGKEIDAAAGEGLARLENAAPDSEVWRMRADLLGTMIRTPYQAGKYRKKMVAAAEEALRLDEGNARAWLAAAKPLLFAPAGQGQDLARAKGYIEKAGALQPDLEQAVVLEAFLQEQSGEKEQAGKLWEELIRRSPNCLAARHALGLDAPDTGP